MSWLWFFVAGWGLPFTAYVILQAIALHSLGGASRLWAAVPLPFMALVVWATWRAYLASSNLWPIVLIFASPVAILWLAACLALGRPRSPRTEAPVRTVDGVGSRRDG